MDTKEVIKDIDVKKMYEALGMQVEYEAALADLDARGNEEIWVLPVLKGLTLGRVIKAFRESGVAVTAYEDDIDSYVTENDRNPNVSGSYAVSFKRTLEPDQENKNISASELAEKGVKGITLLEALLLEFGYFLATGQYLELKTVTLCSGSRDVKQHVPDICADPVSKSVVIYWSYPDQKEDDLRARTVVSV